MAGHVFGVLGASSPVTAHPQMTTTSAVVNILSCAVHRPLPPNNTGDNSGRKLSPGVWYTPVAYG